VGDRRWDPFAVLWLDHDPGLSDRVVRRARRARLRWVWRWYRDPHERAVAARRVEVAFWALRTAGQRRRVLVDMAVQPGAWDWFYIRPEVRALVDAWLPPLVEPYAPGGGPPLGLVEVCDLRVLAREEAALRLERAAGWVEPWPRAWVQRVWWRAGHGRPGF